MRYRPTSSAVARPWFRPKHVGFGYTPQTWQGWAVCLAPIALVLIVVVGVLATR